MSDQGQQTVRQLRASVQEWAADVDEMIMIIGHDRWLDIPIRDFKRIGESGDPVAMVVAWGEMASTRLQISSLPEREVKHENTVMNDDDLYEIVAWHENGREFIYRRRSDGATVKATQHACGRTTQHIGESFVTYARHLQQWIFLDEAT